MVIIFTCFGAVIPGMVVALEEGKANAEPDAEDTDIITEFSQVNEAKNESGVSIGASLLYECSFVSSSQPGTLHTNTRGSPGDHLRSC